jgi:hypothetical protein
MKIIGIILIAIGGIGFIIAANLPGLIGLAAFIAMIPTVITGIGFLLARKEILDYIILMRPSSSKKKCRQCGEIYYSDSGCPKCGSSLYEQ